MKEHVTIVPIDRVVVVDGQPLNFTYSAPANIHAIQWHNGGGEIEFNDNQPNQPITGQADYIQHIKPFVELWEQEYQRLQDEANRAPAPPSLEEKQAAIVNAVQARLDAFAQTRNYDSIFTSATYVASTNPQFALEGRYALEARDATWAKCYEILNAFLAGDIAEPTLQEIMAQLPILEWPVVTNE